MFLRFGRERFLHRARARLRRQNPFYRAPGESAVPDRAFQRPRQVFAMVGGQQSQHACGLVLPAAARAHQFLQEQKSICSELGEALLQQLVFLLMIASGGMLWQRVLLARDSRRV